MESWQLIADLSFADLLLWCRLAREDGFICVAQMRPYTAQTLHTEDSFGLVVRPEELPILERAYLEATTWQRDDPLLIDGVPIRMEAIPLPYDGRVIAVMVKEGAPLTHRRPGRLEENYLECASALSRMVEEGTFPYSGGELDPEIAPRVGDGLVRLDDGGRIAYASPNAVSAYRRLGIVSVIIGETIIDLGLDTAPAVSALSRGIPAESDIEIRGSVVHQKALPFIEGPSRQITGALLLVRDVTELRHRERMLQRKEAMIREVHHRVKNNLQTIASLLRLQIRRLESPDAKRELEEAVRRIASIAVVHETLTHGAEDSSVDFGRVVTRLLSMVSEGLTHPDRRVELALHGNAGMLPPELATPLAVVLVELVQNAVEHAFDGDPGRVDVTMERNGDLLKILVVDDGRGLPNGFDPSVGADAGLGLQIVRALIEDELSGSMNMESAEGTTVTLELVVRRAAAGL